MAEYIKNVAKVKIVVAWKEELVGDEKDTDRFYLRLQPTFTKSVSLYNSRPIGECVARKIKKELKGRI